MATAATAGKSLSLRAAGQQISVFRVTTFEQAMALAEVLARSEIVPKEYRGKPANILVAMQLGAEVGLNPMQSLQSIAVLNGKPSMWGDAVLGVCMCSPAWGGIKEWEDKVDGVETAFCETWRKGLDPITRSFSRKDAERIMMYEDGKMVPLASRPTHRNYPARMRQMRARSWALRDAFPDVLKGLPVAEEVQDYGEREHATVESEVPTDDMNPRRVTDPPAGEVIETKPQAGDLLDRRHEATREIIAGDDLVNRPTTPETAVAAIPLPSDASQLSLDDAPPTTEPEPKMLEFMIGKNTYKTHGITREQMLDTFDLCPKVDKKLGKDKAKEMLKNEFKVASRVHLDQDAGDKYIVRLKEMLGVA